MIYFIIIASLAYNLISYCSQPSSVYRDLQVKLAHARAARDRFEKEHKEEITQLWTQALSQINNDHTKVQEHVLRIDVNGLLSQFNILQEDVAAVKTELTQHRISFPESPRIRRKKAKQK